MTGNVLRRLREAYGFAVKDVALHARMSAARLRNFERQSKSYSHVPGTCARQISNFRMVVRALRELRQAMWIAEAELAAAHASHKRGSVQQHTNSSIPRGTTHWLGYEPVRYVMIHGKTRGFRWDGGWLRSARVEDAAGKAVAV